MIDVTKPLKNRTLAVVLLILFVATSIAYARWVLPVADGSGVTPSSPSIHGQISGVAKRVISVRPESRNRESLPIVEFRTTPKTEFFTAYGGDYSPNNFRTGQYVWVWYITQDPAKAGTPPQAAVVILWSKDPRDKPSKKIRWSYDQQK